MLSVLIQFQCPSVECLFSESKSSPGVSISPLLVIYSSLSEKTILCIVTKIRFDLTFKEQSLSPAWLCYILVVQPLVSHLPPYAQLSFLSKMVMVRTCFSWQFIHLFMVIYLFLHLPCGRHCDKCQKCKVRHGPCSHGA